MQIRELILASSSPRRRALMAEAGLNFKVIIADIDEKKKEKETPPEMVERLAFEKVHAVAKGLSSGLVIGADTIVVLDNEILGKPADENDASIMLKKLSGREHTVYTGISVIDAENGIFHTSHMKTKVKFIELNDEMIERYVATKEPMDKAGSYAIQGVGTFLIERIDGDYSTVVGLSMPLLSHLLNLHGYTVL